MFQIVENTPLKKREYKKFVQAMIRTIIVKSHLFKYLNK